MNGRIWEIDMNGGDQFQAFQGSTRRVGRIVEWMDEKGFGWVECEGKRYFVHIKDFDRGQRRPKAGEEVRFIEGLDPKGRTCTKRVALVKEGKDNAGRFGFGGMILLCLLLVLPLLALRWLQLHWALEVPWWMGAGGMLVVSAITYGMYAHDKRQAVSGGWRVAESSLHLAELLGGWPGAFFAQRRLRHKCSKTGYQVVFWMIVILYQIAAVDVLMEQRLSREVMLWLKTE